MCIINYAVLFYRATPAAFLPGYACSSERTRDADERRPFTPASSRPDGEEPEPLAGLRLGSARFSAGDSATPPSSELIDGFGRLARLRGGDGSMNLCRASMRAWSWLSATRHGMQLGAVREEQG